MNEDSHDKGDDADESVNDDSSDKQVVVPVSYSRYILSYFIIMKSWKATHRSLLHRRLNSRSILQ